MRDKEDKNKVNNRRKGSMTVEAVIALPVFIMLFMFMMYMVNVCHIYLTLNHAADQTVKFNANNAYVYTKIVGITDIEIPDEENTKVLQLLKSIIETAGKDYVNSVVNSAMAGIFESASNIMLLEYAQNNHLDKEKVDIVLFKLPGSQLSGSEKKGFNGQLEEEDILVRIKYRYTMNIPLIGETEFPIVATCVEKAWINGGSGEYVGVSDESFFDKLR